MNLLNKFKEWKYFRIALWSSVAVFAIVIGIVVALLTTGANTPDNPSISETGPSSGLESSPLDTTPNNNNTTPEMENTEPKVENTEPEVENTEPEVENTEPEVENTEPDYSNPFVPTVRFVVAGDLHTLADGSANMNRDQLDLFYKTAYAYSDAQTDYKHLDGIFFVGDATNNGSVAEYQYFFNYLKQNTRTGTMAHLVMGNHEFYDTGKYTAESLVNAPIRFLEQSGYSAVDNNQIIGGYHFITMGMDIYGSSAYFSAEKLAWLKKELDTAVAEDPNKPIFLFQHQPAKDTVIGSYGSTGDIKLRALLDNYPQVVTFSGHTHRPLSNTRFIWQDTFTAVHAGSLDYLNFAIPDNNKYVDGGTFATDTEGNWTTKKDIRNGYMYLIVEIDADNRTRIQIYDMANQKLWGESYIIDSFNPKDFKYTDARKDVSDKPVFSANAALTLQDVNNKTVTVAIPQATSKDVVQSYRVELYQNGTLKETAYRLACTHCGDATPETIPVSFSKLTGSTPYTIKVYAVNSWAKESEPLVLDFTI